MIPAPAMSANAEVCLYYLADAARGGRKQALQSPRCVPFRIFSLKDGDGRHQDPRRGVVMTEKSRREPVMAERDPQRVIALSDAVIAIAVTLLVLDIRAPEDTRHLLHSLLALWPSYVSYVITFMLIGQIWANHHVMFDHIRHADRMVLFLNTLLLMDVALLPFAAAVLASAFRTRSAGHGPAR
jgi:Endosomal/lysosomal potassium channel TMEM175